MGKRGNKDGVQLAGEEKERGKEMTEVESVVVTEPEWHVAILGEES